MISRITKLLLALALVAASLYVVLRNNHPVEVSLTDTVRYNAGLGVVILSVFALGILAATLVASLFALRSYLREKALRAKERQRELFFEKWTEARQAAAAHNWTRAQALWEQILRKDAGNVIARVELSRCLERAGDPKEALRILDEARAEHPANAEVLYRAAHLSAQLGNKTAALDNLQLIIEKESDKRALELGMGLADELGREDLALSYFSKLELLGAARAEDGARLRFRKLTTPDSANKEELLQELRAFVKRSPTFMPAVSRLAALEKEAGRLEEAVQLYLKAAKQSHGLDFYRAAIDLWIEAGKPEKGLAVARAARTETSGSDRLDAELLMTRLALDLNMLDEARTALEGFPSLVERTTATPSSDLWREYHTLLGGYLATSGKVKEAADLWRAFDEKTGSASRELRLRQRRSSEEAPAPVLFVSKGLDEAYE